METALLTDQRTIEIYEKELRREAAAKATEEAAEKDKARARQLAAQQAAAQMKIYFNKGFSKEEAIEMTRMLQIPEDLIEQAAAAVYGVTAHTENQ